MVGRCLDSQKDISSLAQVNRHLYSIFNPRLYIDNIHLDDASALTWAAEHNRLGTAEHFFQLGICKKQKWARKPLLAAAQNGSLKVMRLLLIKGAKPDSRGPMQTPLYVAITNGHEKVAKMLLRFGANPNSKNIHPGHLRDNRPLHMAASRGHTSIVQALLELGADINAVNSHGHTPLDEALLEGRVETFEYLLDRGDILLGRDTLSSLLHTAIWRGKVEIVRMLLAKGADPNQVDANGRAPIHIAIFAIPSDEIARALLERGANPNRQSFTGTTLLEDCLSSGCYGTATILLEHGANPNACNAYGDTLLHKKASSGDVTSMLLLIDHGARVDIRNDDGHTPLFRAVFCRQELAVSALLRRGSDPNATTRHGHSVLHWARQLGETGIVRALVEAIERQEIEELEIEELERFRWTDHIHGI